MKIRALLAGILLATGLGATLGIAHAGAWTANLAGEARCEPAPRNATDTWVVTWGYTNTDSHPAVITAEHDQHSGDQQLIGHQLAGGSGGFLVVSYPASAASDTLTLRFTWNDAKGHELDHKTVSATVSQPEGCDVYVPPTMPEPTWSAEVCTDGAITMPSYTTAAVTGVHYDVVIDGVHHDAQPAGKHTVTLPKRDVDVYVQAWDDTSGAVIHQWQHTFVYTACAPSPTPATSTTPPATHSSGHTPPSGPPAKSTGPSPAAHRKPAVVKPAVKASSTSTPAPSSPTTTELASTGTSYPAGKAALIGLAAILAGSLLIGGGYYATRARRQH